MVIKLTEIWGDLPFEVTVSLNKTLLSLYTSVGWIHGSETPWLLILKIELKVVGESINWLWSVRIVLWWDKWWLNSGLELLVPYQFSLSRGQILLSGNWIWHRVIILINMELKWVDRRSIWCFHSNGLCC